ncbi:hypothetical protein [Azospirillum sp. INR13]|uniref:hypothetical protein n=1 Tax=Azospirillum sp. INR13 TaxID=2596919 RepID=UPI00189216BA|nr:hypothetical protein [Azospirillum sp. INR13]
MITFEDCLAFSDINPAAVFSLHDLGAISAEQNARAGDAFHEQSAHTIAPHAALAD